MNAGAQWNCKKRNRRGDRRGNYEKGETKEATPPPSNYVHKGGAERPWKEKEYFPCEKSRVDGAPAGWEMD